MIVRSFPKLNTALASPLISPLVQTGIKTGIKSGINEAKFPTSSALLPEQDGQVDVPINDIEGAGLRDQLVDWGIGLQPKGTLGEGTGVNPFTNVKEEVRRTEDRIGLGTESTTESTE